MVERKEIVEALKVIQKVCNTSMCNTCVLSDGTGYCKFRTACTPERWKINEPGDKWRALL